MTILRDGRGVRTSARWLRSTCHQPYQTWPTTRPQRLLQGSVGHRQFAVHILG